MTNPAKEFLKIIDAISRVALAEVGLDLAAGKPQLLGAYEHLYDDNFLGQEGIATHYVVLAFVVELENEIIVTPDKQHSTMKWWAMDKLLLGHDVHQYTKAYFESSPISLSPPENGK